MGKNSFDQPVKSDIRAYDKIRKTATSHDYTTCCLVDYSYFKKHQIIATDLSKQQALDSAPKAMKQINFTGNLENQWIMLFITEEAKQTFLDFSQGTVKVF